MLRLLGQAAFLAWVGFVGLGQTAAFQVATQVLGHCRMQLGQFEIMALPAHRVLAAVSGQTLTQPPIGDILFVQ